MAYLRSKILSLRAIVSMFSGWYNILQVFFFGGRSSVILHDRLGKEIRITVDRHNVNAVIQLARNLYRCRNWNWWLTDDSINLALANKYIKPFQIKALLNDPTELLRFHNLCVLSNYPFSIEKQDEEHYLINVNGLKWSIREKVGEDITEGPLLPYVHESYEYRRWFSNIIKPGDIFVDVGAFIGGYSVRACKLGAMTIAIEPDKENFMILSKNLEMNNCINVHLLNVALGSEPGILPLYAPDDEYMSQNFSLAKKGKLRSYVKVVRLDDVLMSMLSTNENVKLIKIDVEGFELEVLKGMENTLKKTSYVMIEVTPITKRKVCTMLLSKGFKLIDSCKHSRYPITWQNLLFKATL